MRLEPPSPMATVQITALMPMVIPSRVSAVRSLFRPSARSAARITGVRSISVRLYQPVSARLLIAGGPFIAPWLSEIEAQPHKGEHPAVLVRKVSDRAPAGEQQNEFVGELEASADVVD